MFTYITEDTATGWAGNSREEAETRIGYLAKSFLQKNPEGVCKICLVDFDNNLSTVYEYTAEFNINCTQY